MRILVTLLATGVVLGCAGGWAEAWAGGPPAGRDLVQATMVADVKAVGAGESFRVGIVLKIKPGWHIYWKNPGDSGSATAVELTASQGAEGAEGVEVSEVRWPVPVKFEQAGGLVGYGYEGEVMLSAVVKVPQGARVGEPVMVKGDVAWLCCEKVCLPGEAKLSLAIAVKEKREEANGGLFEEWESRLPGKGEDLRISSSGELKEGSGEFVISVESSEPMTKVEFFPAPEEALSVEDVSASAQGKRGRIRFDARVLGGQKLKGDALRGVVAVTQGGGERRGVEVEIPLARSGGRSAEAEPAITRERRAS